MQGLLLDQIDQAGEHFWRVVGTVDTDTVLVQLDPVVGANLAKIDLVALLLQQDLRVDIWERGLGDDADWHLPEVVFLWRRLGAVREEALLLQLEHGLAICVDAL